MELLLRYVRTAHDFHSAGPGEEGHALYAAGRLLAGSTGSLVWSELREHAVQSAVAGVRKGG